MAAITFAGLTLITNALQLCGVVGQGETPSAADQQASLMILNGMVDDFATQRLTIPSQERDIFNFVANQSTYTIGPTGANWTATRPAVIDQINVLSQTASPPFEIPMTPLSNQTYDSLTIKGTTAPFPVWWFYNATFPNGSVFVWPVPTDASNYQAVVYAQTVINTFDLTTLVTMPPGYYRMLYYNLAAELFPAFAREPNPVVMDFARRSMTNIKRMNLQPLDLAPGAPLPGTRGIYSIFGDFNY